MSHVDTPGSQHAAPVSLSPEDLVHVESALEDIHITAEHSGAPSNIPPPVFGAGGPMSAPHMGQRPGGRMSLTSLLG